MRKLFVRFKIKHINKVCTESYTFKSNYQYTVPDLGKTSTLIICPHVLYDGEKRICMQTVKFLKTCLHDHYECPYVYNMTLPAPGAYKATLLALQLKVPLAFEGMYFSLVGSSLLHCVFVDFVFFFACFVLFWLLFLV